MSTENSQYLGGKGQSAFPAIVFVSKAVLIVLLLTVWEEIPVTNPLI